MRLISGLLNWQARAVRHHCEKGKCLAQGKFGLEHFICIVISGFGRKARCQIQIAHSHVTVAKATRPLLLRLRADMVSED